MQFQYAVGCATVLGILAGTARAAVVQTEIAGAFFGTNAVIINNPLPGIITATTTYNATIVYDTSAVGAADGSGFRFPALQSMTFVLHSPSGDMTLTPTVLTGTISIAGFNEPADMFVTPGIPGSASTHDTIEFSAGIPAALSPTGQSLYAYIALNSANGAHPLNGSGGIPLSIGADFLVGATPPFDVARVQIYPNFSNIGQANITSISTTVLPSPGPFCAVAIGLGLATRRRR